MRQTEDLIHDLKPVRALKSAHLWALALTALILCAAFVVGVYDFRPEFHDTRWLSQWIVVGKPLLLLLIGLAALTLTARLARPDGEPSRPALYSLMGLSGAVGVTVLFDLITRGSSTLNALSEPFMLCWQVVLTGGVVSYAALWGLWLRRAAPANPVAFGGLSGLAVGALMAAAYALHCDRDWPLYILVFYGAPVLILGALGAILGPKLYRW